MPDTWLGSLLRFRYGSGRCGQPTLGARHPVASPVTFRHSIRMLELPGQPILDKARLVGACTRLPLTVDATRLATEVAELAQDFWGTQGGRVGVHRAAEAVFLRGHAPAEGDLPIEDRPALTALPYARELIERVIGTRPQRCLLARLPAGASVAPHIDRAPYFSQTLRIHVPVATNDQAWMVCEGLAYRMRAGEVWALNNVAMHGVWNAHPTETRTHMIVDFLPDATLLALLAAGERNLGEPRPEIDAHLAALPVRRAVTAG